MPDRSETAPLPPAWGRTQLAEVYDIIGGGTPSTKNDAYWGGDTPWLTSADLHGPKDIRPRKSVTEEGIQESATNRVPAGSIIVATRVSLGKVAIADQSLCFSQDCQALVGGEKAVLPNYALHYLTQAAQRFIHESRGTTISGVTKKQLAELPLPLPPLNEQRRIVEKIEELFTRLDAGVAELHEARKRLASYRQAVLRDAFTGKLTQQWREAHKGKLGPASVLLDQVQNERERREDLQRPREKLAPLDSSGLHELPRLWQWTRVNEIAAMIQYGTSEKATKDSSGIPVLRMGNIQGGRLVYDSLKYLPREMEGLDKFTLLPGDVLFNRTNSAELVGKTAVYTKGFPESVFASYLIRVRMIGDSYDPHLLSWYINSPLGRLHIDDVVSQQVGQANVNGTKLAMMPIPAMPIYEQKQLVQEIERRFSLIDAAENTIRRSLKQADRLRQSILKRAFEGRLVPQDPKDEPAEKLMERIEAEKEKHRQR